jgi:hypothetical protein
MSERSADQRNVPSAVIRGFILGIEVHGHCWKHFSKGTLRDITAVFHEVLNRRGEPLCRCTDPAVHYCPVHS